MPSINSGSSQNQVGRQNVPDFTPALSPREISTQRTNKVLKITSLSILGALAVGTAVAGITLAIVLGSPALAALAVASVLFAGIAVLVHKHLTQKADGNWSQALDINFRELPPQFINANFVVTPGATFSFYQNKKNPQVKLGIQEDSLSGFSLKFLALPRSNTARTVTGQKGIAFNILLPSPQTSISLNTNQAHAFFSTLTKHNQHHLWSASQYQGQTSIRQPFAPTEVRSTKLDIKNKTSIPLSEKETYPAFIGHARGLKLEEFSGENEQVMNNYYNRALFTYENCLKEAIEKGCSVVSVPLFSSVCELHLKDKRPKQNHNYEWLLGCNHLCKKALIEAVNNIALSNPNSLKLLVLLQDPFASQP
ncbi:hypothetical protein [Chlamydia felis Fe/C-56]|uniref:Uncharacterized protein n=1 Tax=Chlamydia felis (strain Fe/C-56) TaxID=264202 RepID=Q253I1_CHLFF|nr:membrane protein [Chlamydia felis]BAE81557.1 hypothetical protein [Chlamydia felis Fe/C-56]